VFHSYVVSTELEERGIGLILGYRPSSKRNFDWLPLTPPPSGRLLRSFRLAISEDPYLLTMDSSQLVQKGGGRGDLLVLLLFYDEKLFLVCHLIKLQMF
jgi:hypothetical protein